MPERLLPVIEIFGPTIQGEGPLCGQQTYFVRLGGCDYRCSWCDTLYAVLPDLINAEAEKMAPSRILRKVNDLPGAAPWVTVSGGNPCIFDLEELVTGLRAYQRHKVAVETQGTACPAWLVFCDLVIVSPKPPSSQMTTDWAKLGRLMKKGRTVLKVVVFDDADFEYAKQVHTTFPYIPFYLSVGSPTSRDSGYSDADRLDLLREQILDRMKWLTEKALGELTMRDATVLPQLHTLLWGQKRGK